MAVTSEVFLPVFYRLAITSTYEVRVVWVLFRGYLAIIIQKVRKYVNCVGKLFIGQNKYASNKIQHGCPCRC